MRIERYHACASFVKELHKNQVDKGGSPYYHHLYEVADNAKRICEQLAISDENFIFDCMEIRLLHDSVEDCDLSFDIIQANYGETVANGVRLMTKPHSDNDTAFNKNCLFKQNYVDYLVRLYQHYLDGQEVAFKAMIVKLSDLKSNLNYQRLGVQSIDELNQKQLKNLLKYHTAYQLLASIIFDKKLIGIDAFKTQLLSAKFSDNIDIDCLKQPIHKIIS